MRPLGGSRRKDSAAKGKVPTAETRHIACPRRLDNAQIFVGHGATLLEGQPEIVKFFRVPAYPDAKDKTPARNLVNRGRSLGRHQWVTVGEDNNTRTNLDTPRAAGQEGQE